MSFDTGVGALALPARFSLRHVRTDAKLVAALCFSLAASLLQSPAAAALSCVVALFLLLISGLPGTYIMKRLLPVNAFFLLLWLLLPLSFAPRQGTPALFSLGPFALYASGLRLALLVTLKGNAIAAALLALCGSSSITENGHALLSLRVPHKLVALLLITQANLARMSREYKRLFSAARLRGFVPRTSLASYATYARLIGLLLIRAWQRSQRVERAMRLRGFAGRFPLIPSRCTCPEETQKRTRLRSLALCFTLLAMSLGLLLWDRLL
ncbi:energy-coupling factor transporter transmembrane protein EcfT [Desulfovibrio sp. OttesenSCG-928-A18]|nr:energy-coupling factor transporter transmembrane protein EcfT [Desulfovibrio sp. OttesenSCG-928-A18]